jgi:hypothetical protein
VTRQTADQRIATAGLAALAPGHRILRDLEGWPVIPGRYGQIEFDGVALAAYTDRPRLHARLLAVPGVTRRQQGDYELRVAVTQAALPAVARLLKSARRRRVAPGSAANLRSRSTSRLQGTP